MTQGELVNATFQKLYQLPTSPMPPDEHRFFPKEDKSNTC